ncbi:MAG: hemolysin XhlA family protein [Sphaerochaeta sp.]|jgi:hypothetical protein|nr:hemolysin XhlA family protein [Sphaerochaeta sp.]
MEKFESEVLQRLTRIETKIDQYDETREKAEEAYNLSQVNKDDITEIKDSMKWLARTVAGAIIVAIIGIVIATWAAV